MSLNLSFTSYVCPLISAKPVISALFHIPLSYYLPAVRRRLAFVKITISDVEQTTSTAVVAAILVQKRFVRHVTVLVTPRDHISFTE